MYVHQVLYDLQRTLHNASRKPGAPEDVLYLAAISTVLKRLKEAKSFHLGVRHELYQVIASDVGKHMMFTGKFGQGIRLPFQTAWFDFFIEPKEAAYVKRDQIMVPKRGLLVEELRPDVLQVCVFNYFKDEDLETWALSPLTYLVGIDRDFDQIREPFDTVFGFTLSPGISSQLKTNILPLPLSHKIQPGSRASDDIQDDDFKDLTVLNTGLLLLSCKNIVTRVHQPSEKLNKKRQKAGKPLLKPYRTLEVSPFITKYQGAGAGEGQKGFSQVKLRMGHFKTYTPESPLFGKHVGRFWWQRVVQENDGVIRDYRFKLPKEIRARCSSR